MTGSRPDCDCPALARRRCDLCPAERPFLTCGAACLRRHLDHRHPGAGSAPARALDFQVEVNRLGIGARTAYQGHRRRLTDLLGALQRGEGLCVLGAGNGNDLDLPALVRLFGEVHLVDIDGEALGRASTAVPAELRGRLTLHAGLDLSGCLEHLDDWGDGLPGDEALATFAPRAAWLLADRLGRRFDVVLSACLLSQLCHPFQNTLALPQRDWRRLFAAVTRLHLETVVRLTRPGGTGVIACDVLCHAGAAVEALRREIADPRLVPGALVRAVASAVIAPDPDPAAVAGLLGSAAFQDMVDRVFVTEPWAWDLGPTWQVVQAVVFRRA